MIDLVLHDPAANELWIVDWKTNRRRSGESDDSVLARLATEYAPQEGQVAGDTPHAGLVEHRQQTHTGLLAVLAPGN